MIPPGLEYYLGQDLRAGARVPRELRAAQTAPPSSQVDRAGCAKPASCLGSDSRVWVVVSGDENAPTAFSRRIRQRSCASVPDRSQR
jgi:hypothetical protein